MEYVTTYQGDRFLIVRRANEVRLDGVRKGCAIIGLQDPEHFRLRLTSREGGPYEVDAAVPCRSPLGQKLGEAFRWACVFDEAEVRRVFAKAA
jgi:hypothetical protein